MSDKAPKFDDVKALRIAQAFMDILQAEQASAGEAAAAASSVFKMALEHAPTEAEREKFRDACIEAMRGTVQ